MDEQGRVLWWERLRTRVVAALPAALIVDTYCVCFALWCLAAAVPSAVRPPRSLQVLLPGAALYLWCGTLALGAALVLVGLWSMRAVAGAYYPSRPGAYKLGLRLLGLATGVYAAAVVIVGGWRGVVAAGVAAAFTITSAVKLLVFADGESRLRRAGERDR